MSLVEPASAQAARIGRFHGRGAGLGPAVAATVVAIAAAVTIAMLNRAYFDVVNGIVRATDPVAEAFIFSSWLLLIGAPAVAARPAAFGFRMGGMRGEWRLVLAAVAVGALATLAALAIVGTTPYSGTHWIVEVVLVPVTEELVFRAVMVTALVAVLSAVYPPRRAALAAIFIDGIAFGAGHLMNATELPLAFVAGQVVFATALGMAAAWLMVRTRSVYPAIVLHAVVNAVVVAS